MIQPDVNYGSAVCFDANPIRFAAVANFYLTDELELSHYTVHGKLAGSDPPTPIFQAVLTFSKS